MIRSGVLIAVSGFILFAVTPVAAQGTVERGKEIFTQQKCSLCHSIEGKGNKKGPLDGVGTKLTAAEIRQWIVDSKTMTEKTKAARKPPMKAFASLPAADVDALVAYLQTLKGK